MTGAHAEVSRWLRMGSTLSDVNTWRIVCVVRICGGLWTRFKISPRKALEISSSTILKKKIFEFHGVAQSFSINKFNFIIITSSVLWTRLIGWIRSPLLIICLDILIGISFDKITISRFR